MGKKTPSAPAPPDPAKTAAAQTASNRETALWEAALNRVNQVTPYGTLTYTRTGGGKTYDTNAYDQAMQAYRQQLAAVTAANAAGAQGLTPNRGNTYWTRNGSLTTFNPQPLPAAPTLEQFLTGDLPPEYTATTALNPEAQKAFDAQQRIDTATNLLAEDQLGRIKSAVGTELDFSGLPSLTQDFSADRDKVVQALIDRNQGNMDRDQSALETKLANQGVMRGSDAWKAAMDDMNRGVNDFRLGAMQAGGAEQSRLYGLTADARQRLMQEMLTKRNQPINEMTALLNGGGGVQMPAFASVPQTGLANTDVAGPVNAAYQGQLAGWNARNQAGQSTMGGLFGLAGTLGAAYLTGGGSLAAAGAGGAATLPWLRGG